MLQSHIFKNLELSNIFSFQAWNGLESSFTRLICTGDSNFLNSAFSVRSTSFVANALNPQVMYNAESESDCRTSVFCPDNEGKTGCSVTRKKLRLLLA